MYYIPRTYSSYNRKLASLRTNLLEHRHELFSTGFLHHGIGQFCIRAKLLEVGNWLGPSYLKYLCSAHYLYFPGMDWNLCLGRLEVLERERINHQLLIVWKVRGQLKAKV